MVLAINPPYKTHRERNTAYERLALGLALCEDDAAVRAFKRECGDVLNKLQEFDTAFPNSAAQVYPIVCQMFEDRITQLQQKENYYG